MNPDENSRKKFWGPPDELLKFDGLLLGYSNPDQIGKVADWLTPQEKNNLQRINNDDIETSGDGTSGYFNGGNTRTQKTNNRNKSLMSYQWNRGSFSQQQQNRGNFEFNRGNFEYNRGHSDYNRGQSEYNRGGKRKNNNGRFFNFNNRYNRNQWYKKSSVPINDHWKLMEDIPYHQLTKLRISELPKVTTYREVGSVSIYDKSYDNISPKTAKPLIQSNFTFIKCSTCDDPIIREGVSTARIFGTDTIISTLMAANRSVAPWDIVIHRVSNLLFYDKRSGSEIELHTVSETSIDPGYDTQINSPTALSLEASKVNQYYSQQCLVQHIEKISYGKNPFFEDENSPLIPSVAYRYRIFELEENLKALIRCEYDAYSIQDKCCLSIKTLLEWGTKQPMQNWRSEFENFSGSTLATEIKNNNAKVAKWTASAIMTGDNVMKIGFVSRNNFMKTRDHSIIGSLSINSQDLANQIGLNMKNAWGIVLSLSKKLLDLPEGKYILLKDHNKQALRLYSVDETELISEVDENENDDLIGSKEFDGIFKCNSRRL